MGSLPIQILSLLDTKNFADESKTVVDFIADYYRDVEKLPVKGHVEPGYLHRLVPDSPPYYPETLDTILSDIQNHVMPGLTHWQSPNFFGYFPASASTAGFIGEMLTAGLCIVGFNWASSPAATELENIVMDWMAKLLKLPEAFLFESHLGGGGVLLPTTCEAVLCTMAAARDQALERIGHESITKLVVYVSDQTHSTVQKAAKLIGIPPSNLRQITTTADTGYALQPNRLRAAMEADVARGFTPLYVCATIGTTGLNAVDPFKELAKVSNAFDAWFHIDGAYAGSAAICPEFRHYLDGVELADSVSLNPHKWLLAGNECCCLWVRDSSKLVESLTTSPEYLRNTATDNGGVVDYKDWQMGLSRKFRAMKMWVVMRRYGASNLMEHIRSDVRMAERFEEMVRVDERFEIVGERRFALVCFRLKGCGSELNRELMEAVNRTGRAFLSHAAADGRVFLRMAVGATLTEDRHVDCAWGLIQEKAHQLLGGAPRP